MVFYGEKRRPPPAASPPPPPEARGRRKSQVFRLCFFAEYGDDIFYGDYEEAVVAFEVYWDGLLWVEEDFVVLAYGVVCVVFYEC